MKTIYQRLAGAALLVAAFAANAGLVRYEFSSQLAPVAPNTGANFAGYVEFDDSLLAPGATISVASFTDWAFSWGNDFSYGIGSDTFDPGFATFQLGALLEAAAVDLCFSATGICDTAQHPVARVSTNGVAATFDAAGNQTSAAGTWSGPVGQVPLPATIALAGLAIVGLAWSRRSRV